MTPEEIAFEAANAANACVLHYTGKRLHEDTWRALYDTLRAENLQVGDDYLEYARECDEYAAEPVVPSSSAAFELPPRGR